MKRALLLLVLCACGSGGGKGTYAAKCQAACTLPASGPCASGQDVAGCQDRCEGLTEGLALTCVQCMVEHSGWRGESCTCYGTSGCCLCGFGPGGNFCLSCAQTDACSAS